MKLNILSTIVLVSILVTSCSQLIIPETGNSATAPAAENTEDTSIIGTVQNIRTQVYAGESNNLKLINGETDLGNNEFVKVEDGGKARLSFPGPINLLLYNQSEVDDIRLEFDDNSNPRIVNRLIRGGFSGYVEPGHQLTINLSFGIQVNVLGTNFFIIFDDVSGFITIGKYDGTLSVTIPGQDPLFLENAELIDVSPQSTSSRRLSFPFSTAQFDATVDGCMSPVDGFSILRRDNQLPQAGQTTTQPNLVIACEPRLSVTNTPEISSCMMPTGFVKTKSAILREGPDLRFYAVGRFNQNDKFTVLGRFKDWYKVEFPSGEKGWLYISWVSIFPDVDPAQICELQFQGVPPCVSGKYFQCP